jgi:hypothetical protein
MPTLTLHYPFLPGDSVTLRAEPDWDTDLQPTRRTET